MITPLKEFEDRWRANSPPLPGYISTINMPVLTDRLPDKWGSALLSSQARTDVSLGSMPHMEETGEIIVGLFARAGTGANVLDDAVTALRNTFHGYMTADNTLQFRAVVGPAEMDPMADGEWWRLGFLVPFVVWSRRVEPVAVLMPQDWQGNG